MGTGRAHARGERDCERQYSSDRRQQERRQAIKAGEFTRTETARHEKGERDSEAQTKDREGRKAGASRKPH